ncbi:hypothetical protein [Nocardia arthritidis]|uniref:Uncharacterized protein n=1 Tax=Nocardia arthritidis TaxID=228602 RepID=A0A6G9Y8H8_9NOCA|nr:hypothetical protein [Nocardia arthritidis]QIS09387.1 hypothetical protein F5544_07405 [Nocardia arthritidis]
MNRVRISVRLSGVPADVESMVDELRAVLADKFGADCFGSHQGRVYRSPGGDAWFFADLTPPAADDPDMGVAA